jgi:hypothetical protein
MSAKSVEVVIGVTLVELLLTALLLGVFHSPKPRDVPVAVVGHGPAIDGLVKRFDATPELAARRVDTPAEARTLIGERKVYGAYAPEPTIDRVLVASAASPAVAGALPPIFARTDKQHAPRSELTDVAPLPVDDSGGESGLFLALVATIGSVVGAWRLEGRVASVRLGPRAALARILILAVFGILAGSVLALYSRHIGVYRHSTLETGAVLALTIFAVMSISTLYNGLLGGEAGLILGLGGFVLIGLLATSGGLTAPVLLPDVWRVVGGVLPPRATIDLLRDYAYFNGEATTTPLILLAAYSAAGAALMLAVSPLRRPSPAAPDPDHQLPVPAQ